MCGYEIIEIPSLENGQLDLDALRAVVGEDTAAMITNPSTLGIFEPEIAVQVLFTMQVVRCTMMGPTLTQFWAKPTPV